MESFRFQLTFFSLALSYYLYGLLIRELATVGECRRQKEVTRLNINSPNALQGALRHKLPSEYVQFWQVLAGLDQSVELCAAEDHELADKTIITFIKTLNSLGRDLSCCVLSSQRLCSVCVVYFVAVDYDIIGEPKAWRVVKINYHKQASWTRIYFFSCRLRLFFYDCLDQLRLVSIVSASSTESELENGECVKLLDDSYRISLQYFFKLFFPYQRKIVFTFRPALIIH